jgi:hypothetical protein
MACGAVRWVQGAVGAGIGRLLLAGDRVRVDGVQDGEAVPGAGCCFLGCDARGEPQGQGGVPQVVGPAATGGGREAGAERGGAGGVPGAAVGALAEDAAASPAEEPPVFCGAEFAEVVAQESDKAGRDGDGPAGARWTLLQAAVLVAGAIGGPGGGGARRGGVDDQQAPPGGRQVAAVLAQGDGFLGAQRRQVQAPEERGQLRPRPGDLRQDCLDLGRAGDRPPVSSPSSTA